VLALESLALAAVDLRADVNHGPRAELDIAPRQRDRLRDAEAGVSEELEERAPLLG
jgi:hypothetical protein